MADNTQLTNIFKYDTANMIFSAPDVKSVPTVDGKPGPSYSRINISTTNDDGTIGSLVIELSNAFCFGVQENKEPKSNDVNGYVLPITLWTRPPAGPTQAEKDWIEAFNRICERCKQHLLLDSTKESINKYELEAHDLKNFNPLYWKKEKGKIVEGQGPMLYAKLLVSKKNGTPTIVSDMYNAQTGEDLTLADVTGKYFRVNAAIKIESIYVGAKLSLQVKVKEFGVTFADGGNRRLLSRPIPTVGHVPTLADHSGAGPSSASRPPALPAAPIHDDSDDDSGSIQDDDGDVPMTPTPARAPVPPPAAASSARKTVPARKK
jgi:hypothetical protein